ncbi:hypothetical protein [Actinomyces respiraculi]|uniref:hypothetical protein n=1 Tax=Actinomyces respiraculi TaxID=2744574 RepID=UPI001420A847|nr:hypothetical protein [Actinomyces respiraculi]
MACGQVASIAPGNPVSPSQHTTSTSATNRVPVPRQEGRDYVLALDAVARHLTQETR